MVLRRFAHAVLLGCAIVIVAPHMVRADPRAVIELFTSQGCSSCPPADQLLGELSSNPSLVALSLPIDYWDYLGWKDTLADPWNSARQRAYARSRGDRQVYTPQVVINGTVHALGSDRAGIERAIAQMGRHSASLSVPIQASLADGKIHVAIAGSEGNSAAEVWLCAFAKAIPIAIARGENRGRTITYHNVARHWVKLGEWKGKAATWSVPVTSLNATDLDGAAIIVQSGNADQPSTILGATTVALH
jgi:hypothetical protein